MIRKNAIRADEGFDPVKGTVTRRDSGLKQIIRGFMAGKWYFDVLNVIYCLGALVCAGLGMWASIGNLILIYSVPQLNAFGCKSPLDASA